MSRFRVGDAVIAASLVLAALLVFLAGFLPKEAGDTLTVTYGDCVERYSLDENITFSVESEGMTLTIEILDGKARVISSTCPDHVCVHQGEIASANETVICVPSGVVLRIEGETDDEDIIAG